ncbi:MAG: substrate-binding domain-containing protein [Gammaproteobacteria bacterium]|nr:substrate-binding domain-containing protein [Gammaproteobacteria bacterium]MDH5800409.1 substrate-binding domain-containing protein [Gammaproteobacteria bacterium]
MAETPKSDSVIRLATTTSTDSSGLLKHLIPSYQSETNDIVHVIAVGTGKALRLLREGDVDVVLVHARSAEERLIQEGYGVNRKDVMYNDFVIVGPRHDPAQIRANPNAAQALRQIMMGKHAFISRGDDSGTHKKETSLWKQLGLTPVGRWYREAGQGMGRVLQMASELDAYTLTDRGTWLAYLAKSPLEILVQGDQHLFNPYGIIAVNPQKYPDANYKGANRFIRWITSLKGQQMIGRFAINGKQLFIPMAMTQRAQVSEP